MNRAILTLIISLTMIGLSRHVCLGQQITIEMEQSGAAHSTYNDINYWFLFVGEQWGAKGRFFLQFDLETVSAASIEHARLDLFPDYVSGQMQLGVFRVTESWSPSSISWNNQPTFDSTAVLTFSSAGWVKDQWRSVHGLGDLVKGWAHNAGNYGLMIMEIEDNPYGCFYIKDNNQAGKTPRMVLNYDTIRFHGVLVDSAAGLPIENMRVHVYAQGTTKPFLEVSTDANGVFDLEMFYGGTFIFKIDGLNGFMNQEFTMSFADDEQIDTTITIINNPHAIGGNYSGRLTKAGSPYLVVAELVVPADSQLQIDPGVEVLFNGRFELKVRGCLEAIGTEQDSIRFSAVADTVYYGLEFKAATCPNILKYCVIEKAINDEREGYSEGGGISAWSSNLNLTHSTIQYNSTSAAGGGIYITGDMTIMHNVIRGNKSVFGNYAFGGGAGMALNIYDLDKTTIISNNLIYGNMDENTNMLNYEGGGGIRLESSSYTIFSNNTLFSNSSGKGSNLLLLNNPNVTIVNNIFNGHLSKVTYPTWDYQLVHQVMHDYSDSLITIGYNVMEDNAYFRIDRDTLEQEVLFDETNRIGDPLFADPAGADFTLMAGSPCIDNGTRDTIGIRLSLTDHAGGPRVVGDYVDMGAYESEYGVFTTLGEQTIFDHLRIFPNPVTDQLRLETETTAIYAVELYDGLGKMLLAHSFTGKQLLDMRSYPQGIYLLLIKGEKTSFHKLLKK